LYGRLRPETDLLPAGKDQRCQASVKALSTSDLTRKHSVLARQLSASARALSVSEKTFPSDCDGAFFWAGTIRESILFGIITIPNDASNGQKKIVEKKCKTKLN
jgi:hypothetical protein